MSISWGQNHVLSYPSPQAEARKLRTIYTHQMSMLSCLKYILSFHSVNFPLRLHHFSPAHSTEAPPQSGFRFIFAFPTSFPTSSSVLHDTCRGCFLNITFPCPSFPLKGPFCLQREKQPSHGSILGFAFPSLTSKLVSSLMSSQTPSCPLLQKSNSHWV